MSKPRLAKDDKDFFFSPQNLDTLFQDIRVCFNNSCDDKQLNISSVLCNLCYDLDLMRRPQRVDENTRGKAGIVGRSIV